MGLRTLTDIFTLDDNELNQFPPVYLGLFEWPALWHTAGLPSWLSGQVPLYHTIFGVPSENSISSLTYRRNLHINWISQRPNDLPRQGFFLCKTFRPTVFNNNTKCFIVLINVHVPSSRAVSIWWDDRQTIRCINYAYRLLQSPLIGISSQCLGYKPDKHAIMVQQCWQ